MHILCTICSDLINQAENIYVTKCGHIFHHHCLVQWTERSKTCPQCRNKVTDKCMFRMFPTVSNENSGEDAATLQSRLDNAQLELRQQRAKFKEKDDKIATMTADLKKQEDITSSYEKRLISYESKVTALREQLMYANIQNKETQKYKDENESLKKNMQTLIGLQKVLNATTDDVEQMLQGYSDLKTIATFATALKRALCESESKKKEWRDRLHMAKQQIALGKKNEADLQNKVKQLESDLLESESTIESLRAELKSLTSSAQTKLEAKASEPIEIVTTPKRDVAPVMTVTAEINQETPTSNVTNTSFNTMVNNIENSDSPYLNLKQGGLLCLTALQRAPLRVPNTAKPSEQLLLNSIKNATKKRMEAQKPTSIFHRKEPMKIDSFDIKTPLDISYDGMGGHSKLDTFPVPKKSPIKSCIPKLSAKHKLKRPNPAGNHDIEQMLKKLREQ
ncbi:uncharacterized protein LOC142982107 [Anticarsia gemmatalis]|uniref:uncharacterized protein LOC142982107 n=1 Tax=Anticarsia gemmatalis TaxID=129554 RepID=UPI003F762309